MESTAAIAFGAALAGAVFGGGASALGAMWVSRREQTRSARIRIYDEDMPAMSSLYTGSHEYAETLWRLHRASVIAGSRDRKYADRIMYAYEADQAAYRDLEAAQTFNQTTGSYDAPEALRSAVSDAAQHLNNAINEYRDWLEKKIR